MKCKLPLTGKLNTFENDLGGWTIVVFAVTTAGLLFYHMTQEKTLPMKDEYAALVAIVLLLCAVAYSAYALYNFYQRTGDLLHDTEKCSHSTINNSRLIYSIITFVVCVTLLFVSFRIFKNTSDDLLW